MPELAPCNVLMTAFGQLLLRRLSLELDLRLSEMHLDCPLLQWSHIMDILSLESADLGFFTLQSGQDVCRLQ